jgi:flagellar motility protein MotE (MotC chaperone)
MKFLKSSLFASILGLLLYAGITIVFWKAPAVAVGAHAELHEPAPARAPSWEFQSPEADLLLVELKEQKAALAKREKELGELAARLQAERLELNVVTQVVHQMQAQLDATMVRITADEATNIKKLARTYAAMAPDGAAPIMKELEDSTLMKILAVMKDTESAPVLEAIGRTSPDEAKRVARLTERLRFYLSQPKDGKKAAP